MTEHVTLSVSIVVYKKYEDVLLAIDSIERFTDPTLSKKIYIVDNSCYGDDNDYKKTFLQTISKYSDVVYQDTKKNLGFGKGHNFVLLQLDSDYHAIVNPDIVFCTDAFSQLIAFLNEKPEVGMTAPILTTEYGKTQSVFRRDLTVFDLFCRYIRPCRCLKERHAYHTMNDIDKTQDFECEFVQGSFLVVRTGLFKQIGGFDDRYFMYAEDADLCKTIRKTSKIVVYPEVKVIHKWEKASHSNFRLMRIHTISLMKYFCKWGWKLK